jgi:UDP-glucose 4-epimerase
MILVTGGAGFIGGHLAEALTKEGRPVRVLDERGSLFSGPGRYVGSILSPTAVEVAMAEVDTVVHLADLNNLGSCAEDPVKAVEVNVGGTAALVKAAAQAGVKRFILASSASVYGELPAPHREIDTPEPASVYGASKLSAEMVMRCVAPPSLDTIALRLFNVYGPGSKGVVSTFAQAALAGTPLPMKEGGAPTRDFIHVRDVVRAFIACIDHRFPLYGPEKINIGRGVATSIGALRFVVGAFVPGAADIENVDVEQPPLGPEEVLHSHATTERAEAILNFRAEVSLREGVEEQVAYEKKLREASSG